MLRLLTTLCLLVSTVSYGADGDTIKVYFDLAIDKLNSNARHQLDSLAYNDMLLPHNKYGIIGYADYLGSEASNEELSQRRANNVKAYLSGLGISSENIITVTAMGEVDRDQEQENGYPEDRRVDIIIGGFKEPVIENKLTPKPEPKINIEKVKKNETITLDRIFFKPGSHMIREDSREQLVQLYVIMKNTPTLKIRIEGHICCHTNNTPDAYDYDAQEFKLSTNRAKYVYDYLIGRGINKNRLSYIGFSNTKPLRSPERTPMDEDMNRRVEIRIIDK